MSSLRRTIYEDLGYSQAALDQLEFDEKARARKIPLRGMIQLTNRCNLRCCHCYIHNDRSVQEPAREISDARLLELIDEMADAGCLYLTFTGGEPLSRPLFSELYIKAKKKGMLISVFSNGTLVDDDYVALFHEYRPRHIEMTLYGATRETYERITRVPGSYDRCLHGVRALLDAGIQVRLKTLIMTLNVHELEQMEAMADAFGVPFRSSSEMMPTIEGDCGPLEYRISAEQAVDVEMRSAENRNYWEQYAGLADELRNKKRLFQCSVGLNSFALNADGLLQPCEQLRDGRFLQSVLDQPFEVAWHKMTEAVCRGPISATNPCAKCELKRYCKYCPAIALLENGAYEKPSAYCCEMARLRYKKR